jgi:ribosomal-protein-alanine N-acetyltransferase
VIRYCFEEYSNTISPVNRIQAHCKLENVASAKVMEKIGMQFEATHRQRVFSKNRFWDMKVYAILKEDWLKTRKRK